MNIQECKEFVSELINDKYKKDLVLKQITTQEIEQNGFLLKEHADAISESAKHHSLIVVFRQTGKDSLDRIRQGNPCKGHALLSKTVKIKNEKKTYICKDDIFNKVKGLVGYGHGENGKLILDGLYAYENNNIVQKKIDEVSPCRYGAPLAFIICASKDKAWSKEGYSSYETDASICTTYMMLETANLGLGSVWVGMFDTAKTKEVFNIPEEFTPISMLMVGHKKEGTKPLPTHNQTKIMTELVEFL